MAEYIDRDAAIETVKFYDGDPDGIPWAIRSLKIIPAADVRPVVRGKWIEDDETGEIYCSECGRTTNDRHDEIQEFDGKKVIALCHPRYCGFCGANMRGDEDDKAENP